MSQKHPIRHNGRDPHAALCNGKKRYDSDKQALVVKEQQELIHHGLKLNVYKCSDGCRGWHLTRTVSEN